MNRDKLIWGPTAEEWIPERWLELLPSSVAGAHLPSVYSNLYVNLSPHQLALDTAAQNDLYGRREIMHRLQVCGGRNQYALSLVAADGCLNSPVEVVLYVLISRFRFEPAPNADVHWNMYNFATPVVDDKPSLPLKMTMLVP